MLNIYWLWILYTIVFLTFDYYKNQKYKNNIIYFTFILLIFFVGFRYESVDYELYSKIFNSQSFENINFPFYSKGGQTQRAS